MLKLEVCKTIFSLGLIGHLIYLFIYIFIYLFIYLFIQNMFIERQRRLYMFNHPQIIEIIGDILTYFLVFYKIESWYDY